MTVFPALLATATLFGGMALYSFGFAPLVFRALPIEQAGRVIRVAFPHYYLFVIAVAALASGLLLGAAMPLAAAVMAVVALVGLFARHSLMPRIELARAGRAAGDAAAARRFRRLHGVSVLLNLGQLAGTAYVLHGFV
jgi:hypothetical protein